MKRFTKIIAIASTMVALAITPDAGANGTLFSKNSESFDFSLKTTQNWDLIHKIFPNIEFRNRFIPVVACINQSNGRIGVLCLDGFCDTSPSNLCNGHDGISPGHHDNGI